jgi:hypothetical protein
MTVNIAFVSAGLIDIFEVRYVMLTLMHPVREPRVTRLKASFGDETGKLSIA